MRAPMQCVFIFTPKNANAVHQNQPVRQGQVPCMMSIPCMSSAESLSEPESERHDGNSSGSDEDLPNRKRLCETTSLAKHRGERVNGSVGLQSHLTSKPTECEYGYRTHNGASIKPRSTR